MLYEIFLTVGAFEEVREMDIVERSLLADSLRKELLDDDGTLAVDAWVRTQKSEPVDYPVRHLKSGHVIIFRQLKTKELKAMSKGRKRPDHGVLIFDILSERDMPSGGVVLPSC